MLMISMFLVCRLVSVMCELVKILFGLSCLLLSEIFWILWVMRLMKVKFFGVVVKCMMLWELKILVFLVRFRVIL